MGSIFHPECRINTGLIPWDFGTAIDPDYRKAFISPRSKRPKQHEQHEQMILDAMEKAVNIPSISSKICRLQTGVDESDQKDGRRRRCRIHTAV